MIKKNDLLVGEVEGLGTGGEGIIRHEDVVFFVPYCLQGEKIEFRVLKVDKKIGYGKVEKILTPSPDRVAPVCPSFYNCGGCDLQHLSYEKQLEFKKKLVKDTLKKIGGIDVNVRDTVPCSTPYGYRNKMQLPVGTDKNGEPVVGFYAERSHRIVPVQSCSVHPDWSEKLVSLVYSYLKEKGVSSYDENTKTGILRHVVVRELNKKFVVTFVTNSDFLPQKDALIALLKVAFDEFTFWHNVNKKDTNVIFGEKFSCLYGNGFFEAEEHGIIYEAGPKTFVQVNPDIRQKLYDRALASVENNEVVIDAYSGGGLLTAMISKRVNRVYGIEIEEEAVQCADTLKKKNGLRNMTNICGRVEDELSGILEKEKGKKLGLILDPPRAGIARSVLYALKNSGIEKLTIISCNPATLARDLGILTGRLEERDGELRKAETVSGERYEIEEVIPFDMFSQTKHCEIFVRLARKAE